MDLFNSVFGDNYTREMILALGLLLILAVLWLAWKFFFAMFKHVLMAVFLTVLCSGVYYYVMSQPPPQDPNVGKHAYGASSSRYLGVIEAADEDSFVIKQPGGQATKLAKARVIVKDKMDPVTVASPSPSPAASQKPKPATKPATSGKKPAR
jgi:hypothetical protein